MATDRADVVVLAYLYHAGEVLLTRRLSGVHQAGRWEFPGGKVEAGETFSTALQRELLEEIGITAGIGDEIAVTRYRYPDRTVELHLFRCHLLSGTPEALQVAEIRWVPIELLANFDFPPASAALLAACRDKGNCHKE